jgi:hypothetical protein
MGFNWTYIHNRNLHTSIISSSFDYKHPKCLGDGVDDCGYNTKISCDECKFNSSPFGRKDPNAKRNQF